MRAALLMALLAACAAEARDRRCGHNRTNRTGDCEGYAFFEAFPASGAGTSGACSTTTPTGAKGEALTFTRTGNATCSKQGLATTGILDGDLVVLSGNQPRVEYDSQGVLGLRVESSRQNVLLQSGTITDVVYADVATPTLTGSQTDPFGTTTAVQVEDNDAAAFEGRQQTVTATAGQPYTMHCYVKGGTATTARISIDGTAQDITGLSTTTWSIVERTDASASAASIVAQVLVGNATSTTGTVKWGGCQVELGSYRTSYIPTTSAAVTRNAETASFTPVLTTGADFSFTENFIGPANSNACAGFFSLVATSGPTLYQCFVNSFIARISAGGQFADSSSNLISPLSWQTGIRWGVVWDRATSKAAGITNGTLGTFGTANAAVTSTPWSAVTLGGDGIHSRLCGDQSQTRCR